MSVSRGIRRGLRLEAGGRRGREARGGFMLIEIIIVVSILSLFVLLVQLNLFGLLRRNTFRAQIQEFVSVLQMAVSGAAETGRRYEVVVDLVEQGFLLRQITSSDLSEVLEEEIIAQNFFSGTCRVAYVEFDDGDYTHEFARFRAGRAGWQYGGKIVLLDEDEQPYSVVVNRLNRIVELVKGEVELATPKAKEDVPF